jgi:DNA-binding beta-propeller fold protein YncE
MQILIDSNPRKCILDIDTKLGNRIVMHNLLKILMMYCISMHVYALPCYITMVKDSCWTEYNLTVDVIDASNDNVIATISVPKGESWARHEMTCQPEQVVNFRAKFSPVFWTSDTDKVFSTKKIWSFPDQINAGDGAWNMTICFADYFSGVPLPPEGSGQCVCDTKNIPPIKPLIRS